MVDPARLIPTTFVVAFADIADMRLSNVKLSAGRIVTAQAGKRHVFQPFGDLNVRIVLFHPPNKVFDVGNLEPIMVDARLYAGISRQYGHTYDAVANMTAVGILLAGFV